MYVLQSENSRAAGLILKICLLQGAISDVKVLKNR
jgi:hypothetical protein